MSNNAADFLTTLQKKAESALAGADGQSVVIQVGSATCEHAAGSMEVLDEFQKLVAASGRSDVSFHRTGCTGRCSKEPIVGVFVQGKPPVKYELVNRDIAHKIFTSHVQNQAPLAQYALDDSLDADSGAPAKDDAVSQKFTEMYGDIEFFKLQKRIAMRNSGVIDPDSLDEYVRFGGFKALATCLGKGDPNWVINEVLKSKIRGRGGAGFPTGKKWQIMASQPEKTRYLICNGDEGDPGAFMDRGMLESDPFNVVEGMMVAAYAVGAVKGFYYIRAEYPLAIRRIQNALDLCRANGLLGENVMNSGWSFDLEIRLGAGAFVCGEETALIRSIEGKRGQPKVRPPYPAVKGLWGKPTIINNVETFANITAIINFGGDWFAGVGTESSGGTKVFALAGKVKHTGLVEVPLGIPIKKVVFDIGGGVQGNELKAVQTGGPAGGFIPASQTDTPVDFDPLAKAGSIMGSGGMIVLSDEDCMVDLAKFYLSFTADESCGKCTPCREGTTRMLEILDKITSGNGEPQDIDRLERLAKLCQQASLCALGRAAPNPVLSSIKHFRDEYDEHIVNKKCRAKKCAAMVSYVINEKKCIGCMVCVRKCPAECISGNRKEPHHIDQSKCIKCGQCIEACRLDAIDRV
ncbi:MAG: NADH-quinone oxidoreductase subunit NuoF [Holophagales bacterium]|jgi:NADH:ubiquinone oxidoreductase subunit F (NADH-binding)/NAD-dependent dihydropyrimidine dehydrogenase PreA subunit/(2Fe-2S) ferredoxin|nr:NADH-quinone oxidoreductase subunit NuoF [Holophagales bacterium]